MGDSKMIRSLFSALVVLLFAFNMQAQLDVGALPLKSKLPQDSKVTVGKLDNGLTYYIRENSKPENRAELQIVILAGSSLETPKQLGLAHFTEHMCFNGTKNFPKGKLVSFLESTGMRFGADVNASTGFDRTYYTITIPTDKDGMIDQGLQVLADWLSNVSFDEDEIEAERGVILEEWRMRDSPQMKAFMQHFAKSAGGSIFPDRWPIGDTAVFMNATREQFLDYYRNWYRPDISAVIAVGDFDKKEMEAKIKNLFAPVKNPNNQKPLPEQKIEITNAQESSTFKHPEITNANINFEIKHPPMPEGTHYAYKNNIMHGLIQGMINQRISERTREAEPPYLNAGLSYSNYFVGDIAVTNLTVIPNQDDISKSVSEALNVIFRAKQHGFSQSELDRVKSENLRFIQSAYAERDKTESMTYAQEYYRAFYEDEGFPGINYELQLYQAYLPQITLEEVNEAYADYFAPENLFVSITAPDKIGVTIPQGSDMIALYKSMKTKDYPAYEDVDTDKPLLANEPTPGSITKERKIESLGITELTLSNGAKVYLKKTDFKNDQILFSAHSFGGASLYPEKDYLDAVYSVSVPSSCGLGEFNRTTLDKMLAGKIADVRPYVSDYSEGLSGAASPQDIETFMKLVYLNFTAPREDSELFYAYMKRLEALVENQSNDPNAVFRDSVNQWLYNGHYFNRPLTKEAIKKINYEKAYKLYNERFASAADFEFAFIGNFDVKELKELIKKYIASLPSDGKQEQWKDQGERIVSKNLNKKVFKGSDDKSTVQVAITGDIKYNFQNKFDLNAMVEVLNIRLREVIREEKGGVYSIYAYDQASFIPKEEYKIFIGYTCDPERVDELIGDVKMVMNEVRDGKFDEVNIGKVKEILKAEFETRSKENRFWQSIISQAFFMNQEDMYKDYENKYNAAIDALSKKDIVAAANEYLKLDSFKQFVMYPEDTKQ